MKCLEAYPPTLIENFLFALHLTFYKRVLVSAQEGLMVMAAELSETRERSKLESDLTCFLDDG